MPIHSIEIEGFRSVRDGFWKLRDINLLIGENGSGKTNVLLSVLYFYKHLTGSEPLSEDIFDSWNPLRNEVRVRITYDMGRIRAIANRNRRRGRLRYDNFYQKILAVSPNDRLTVEMRQQKNGKIRWNVDYNLRQIVHLLFPLYAVDARQVELTDWSELWNLVGDLLKLEKGQTVQVKEEAKSWLASSEKRLDRRLQSLVEILEEQEIGLASFNPKQFGQAMAQLILDGKNFQTGGRRLGSFSNGTNAYHYTKLLLEILRLSASNKMKEPIVLLDEPELSLHHSLIDRLAEDIFDSSDRVQYLISTHSSRLVKDVMVNGGENCAVEHVALQDRYSLLKSMHLFSPEMIRERVQMTDSYANAYFARMVVSVEGESELELFQNAYLCELFPVLRQVDFMKGMSNRVVQNIISPNQRGHRTAAYALVDMDKVIEKRQGKNEFVLKSEYFGHREQEAYFFGDRRNRTLIARREIERMAAKCRFSYEYPFFSCKDGNFISWIKKIQLYLEQYQTFAFSTTLEGSLINRKNLALFRWYLHDSEVLGSKKALIEKLTTRFSPAGRCNYLRLVFSGKSDYLMGKRQIQEENPRLEEPICQTLGLVGKTRGWIAEWLEYFFWLRARDLGWKGKTFSQFRDWCRKKNHKELLREAFQDHFPEIWYVIQKFEMTFEHRNGKIE